MIIEMGGHKKLVYARIFTALESISRTTRERCFAGVLLIHSRAMRTPCASNSVAWPGKRAGAESTVEKAVCLRFSRCGVPSLVFTGALGSGTSAT